MKLPLTIGQKIVALPDEFMGSFTVHTNGKGEWTLEIVEKEREKYPEQFCEIVCPHIDLEK